jgi:hypothetical protein
MLGVYVRLRLEDTPVFRALQEASAVELAPIGAATAHSRSAILLVFACTSVGDGAKNLLHFDVIDLVLPSRQVAGGVFVQDRGGQFIEDALLIGVGQRVVEDAPRITARSVVWGSESTGTSLAVMPAFAMDPTTSRVSCWSSSALERKQ